MIFVSIISHGHGSMVVQLTKRLLQFEEIAHVNVTLNIPESIPLPKSERVTVTENIVPQGFGTNHNVAFSRSNQPYFCLLNPDIELSSNPFPALLGAIRQHQAAIAAPMVLDVHGNIEDSIRRFPTFFSLLSKACGCADGRYEFACSDPAFSPEWVAGMFMLFRSDDFRRLRGFDGKFFLYYEDVDICARAWKAGMKVLACPSVSAIHDAQRASRRNPQHMKWHAASMMRYFWKHAGRLPAVN